MAVERNFPSPLAHYDPADLLDALSTGIVVLDAQLCVVYANVAAQTLLAMSFKQARGRPFSDLLAEKKSDVEKIIEGIDFVVLDASLRHRIRKGIHLLLNGENLTDRHYIATQTGPVKTLGSPLLVMGGIRIEY